MCPQLTGNLKTFLLREISDTAHPRAEAPQGQHRTLTRNLRILVQNILRFSEKHEEVHLLISHKQALGSDIACSEVAGHRSRRMHKDAVAAIREIERHGLVLSVGLRSLRVGDGEMHLLPYLVQRCKRLTATVYPLAWRQQEHRIDAARIVAATLDKRERQQLHLRRIVVNDMACLRQHLSLGISHHNPPRTLLDLDTAILR